MTRHNRADLGSMPGRLCGVVGNTARSSAMSLMPVLNACPGCEMSPDTQVRLGAPVPSWHNPAPALRNILFWKESFVWHLRKRKTQRANSALLRCTSGLCNSRCYPENSTLKSTNSASAPAAEEISALILH